MTSPALPLTDVSSMAPSPKGLGLSLSESWLESVTCYGFSPLEVPEEFVSRRNGQSKGPIGLSFSRLRHKKFGHEWRQTLIQGPRVEILCVMGFPANGATAPVFAAETIAFHGSIKIAVMDLEPAVPAYQAPRVLPWWDRLLQTVSKRLDPVGLSLVQSPEPWPDWAHECFSSQVIYCRPQPSDDQPRLAEVLQIMGKRLLDVWLEWIAIEDALREAGGEVSDYLSWDHYRQHHAKNTPGWPFLSAQFGREWTEQFLTGHMYGPDFHQGIPARAIAL